MSDLKDREQKILDFMKSEIRMKGYPPTVREICTALNIKSTSTVHKDIESLVKQGYLKKDPAKPRALMIVDGENDYVSHMPSAADHDTAEREDVIDIPVIGQVAAGTPILAEQNIEDTFPVPSRYVKGTSFMHICPPKATADITAPAQRYGLTFRAAASGPTIGNAIAASPQNVPDANDSSPMATNIVTGSSEGLTVFRAASTTNFTRPSWLFTSIRTYDIMIITSIEHMFHCLPSIKE